jgi:hypothetical protein
LDVPPDRPYSWENGKHDIELIKPNVPIIAMTLVHEGAQPKPVDQARLAELKEATQKENPSEDEITTHQEMQVRDSVYRNFSSYVNWYLVLVACTQVRELSDSNLQNYTRMCGAPPLPVKVKSFLTYWAASQAPLAENESVRKRFVENKFYEYHTTGSSTPALCKQAIEEAGNLDIFGHSEVAFVQDAYASSHDISMARFIPDITLIKTRAVLEAAGTLPDIWYMGDKAISKFSGKKYSALVKLVRAVFKKQTMLDGIDEDDLSVLASKLTSLVQSFPNYDDSEDEDSDGDPPKPSSSKKKQTDASKLRSLMDARDEMRRGKERGSAGDPDLKSAAEEGGLAALAKSLDDARMEYLGAGEYGVDFQDATSDVGPTADI